MKRILVIGIAFIALTGCNGGDKKDKPKEQELKEETKKEEVKDDNGLSGNPVYQKGVELVGKSDCLTCHKIDETVTGPSYRDVANKYADYKDTIVAHLAGKIINGGTGVWGQIPMTPHPALSPDDAKSIVKYILLLKK